MRIAFVQTAHLPSDERIARHQVPTLESHGHTTLIVSTRTDVEEENVRSFNATGLRRWETITRAVEILSAFSPDLIICDTPVAVLIGLCFRSKQKGCKLLYDITEWYPSKKNLRNRSILSQFLRILLLPLASLFAGVVTNGFIFGEYYKALPFRKLFFWKRSCKLSYYPDLKYVEKGSSRDISKKCSVLYCGPMTEEKGFLNVIRAMNHTAAWYAGTHFDLTVLTANPPEYPKRSASQPDNLDIHYSAYLPFERFCEEIGKHDICLDIRERDFENTHCLPIKLFYYMAAGKPTVITALKSVVREVPELSQCGALIERPFRAPEVAAEILAYVKKPELYQEHCAKARELSEQKYNWQLIADDFVKMVESYEKR